MRCRRSTTICSSGARKKLQRVPHQRAVEEPPRKVERGVEECSTLQRIGLVLVKIAFAEALVELVQEIVGIQAMAVIGDES